MSLEEQIDLILSRISPAQDKSNPKLRAELRRSLGQLHDKPENVVIFASYHPGFDADLTSWNLQITAEGLLTQTVNFYRAVHPDARQPEPINVGGQFVTEVLRFAAQIDFWTMKINSGSMITDAERCSIALRDGERRRTFSLDGPGFYANEGEFAATQFIELWNLIHQHAPYPKKE